MRALTAVLAAASAVVLLVASAPAQCPTVERQEIYPGDGGGPRRFGFSVALDGDLMVVGAHFDSTGGMQWAGAAYVFRWDGHHWREEQKLIASDADWFALFGRGVAVSDGTIVVTAPDKTVSGKKNGGKAYVFRHDGTRWVEVQTLVASNPGLNQFFGRTLVMQGNRILISAPNYATGPNPGQVYVFEDGGAGFVQVQRLTAPDGAAGDRFGYGMALDRDLAVIGAYLDDDTGIDSGSVYFYRHNGTRYRQVVKLLAPDGAAGDEFGQQVALRGEVALIGASRHDAAAVDAGAAYVYRLDVGGWTMQQKLLPPHPVVGANFGYEVAAGEDLLAVGAYLDDGVAAQSGAAYAYRPDGSQWSLGEKLIDGAGVGGDEFAYSLAAQDHRIVVGAPADGDQGFIAGAVYYYEFAPFTLAVSPATVHAGESVLLGASGGEPGARLMLAAVAVDGVPALVPVLFGQFQDDRHWSVRSAVPPGLVGLFELQLFSPDDCGCLRTTNRAALQAR